MRRDERRAQRGRGLAWKIAGWIVFRKLKFKPNEQYEILLEDEPLAMLRAIAWDHIWRHVSGLDTQRLIRLACLERYRDRYETAERELRCQLKRAAGERILIVMLMLLRNRALYHRDRRRLRPSHQ